jgi:hypothetical protein
MTIKTLLVFSLISVSIALSGCGGSNSSTADLNSKTTVAFANKSAFNYDQVSIVDSEGRETFAVGNVRCPSGATRCYINADVTINAGDSLLFKNSNGVMVGAITAAESSSGYTALSPSSLSTGFYLAKWLSSEMLNESGISWQEFNQRTLTFFTNYDSPDGSADPFEELGDYYASQITKTAASDRAFLDALKARLLEWEVVDPNVFPGTRTAAAKSLSKYKTLFANSHFTLISKAHAQEAPCNAALTTFLSFAGAVGQVLPIVGDGVQAASDLGASYCAGASSDTALILSQLNNLQASVNNMSKTLATLSNFVFTREVNLKTTEFQDLAVAARQLDKDYQGFLLANNSASLEQFFANAGGWQAGVAKGKIQLQAILNAPYTNDGSGIYTRIIQTTANADFDTYLAALSNSCGQLTLSSPDNFLARRQICNNAILANSGRLVAAQSVSLLIFKDIYATLNKYQLDHQNTYALPSDFTSFATAYSDAKKKFTAQQVAMISNYETTTRTAGAGGGYFDVFAGLDTTLTGNLQKLQCNQSEERGRRDFPAIVGWYAPGSTDGARSYIETYCKVPTLNERITARYHYNDQGAGATPNNVANVLGVPIAAIYLENDRPLANSQANISSESIDWIPSQPLYLDAPSVNVFGTGSPPIRGLLVSPTDLPKSPDGGRYSVLRFGEIIWVRVRLGEGKNSYVAKIGLSFNEGGEYSRTYYTDLTCLAVPCRVDPNNNDLGLWLEGIANGLKLDLVDTRQTVSGGHLLRLETR